MSNEEQFTNIDAKSLSINQEEDLEPKQNNSTRLIQINRSDKLNLNKVAIKRKLEISPNFNSSNSMKSSVIKVFKIGNIKKINSNPGIKLHNKGVSENEIENESETESLELIDLIEKTFDEEPEEDTLQTKTVVIKNQEYIQMPKALYVKEKSELINKIENYEKILKQFKGTLANLDLS